MSVLKTVFSYLTIAIISFTSIICPTPESTDSAEITNEFSYALLGALVTGQGLDEDEDYFYTSGSIATAKLCCLAKIDKATGEIINQKIDVLPTEFKKNYYDHIGDISVENGKIYAPVEGVSGSNPYVLIFDADTLEYTGTYYELDAEYLTTGMPWCATDDNYLYSSTFHNPEYIAVYNISDMSFSHTITLSKPVARVQAGDVLNGKLYLNCDPHEGNKTVYEVDVVTGETNLLFDRKITGFDTETEGLCAQENSDGTLTFYIADYNKIISTFIRTYKVK